MAQLQPVTTGAKRPPKASLKIDMTPMVDLGFLLITFFIFTTSVSEPTSTQLYMPADGSFSNLAASNSLTLLLGKEDKIYFYKGKGEEALERNAVGKTTYDPKAGLGNIIRSKQKAMGSNRNDLMLLIKPLDQSTYKNVIDVLDEVLINSVSRYAIIEPSKEESGQFQ